MSKYLVLILISVLLGTIRVLGVTHIFFQAIAHLFVGGLIFAYIVLRPYKDASQSRRVYIRLAIALSILETACFVWFRVLGHKGVF